MSEDDRPDGGRKSRKASKEARRVQLIDATLDSLAKRGYADTTLAVVADGAGLSRGIVNFHFDSKDNLLIETLKHLADEYADHWRTVLDRAGDRPSEKLWALVHGDFDKAIFTRRKVAAWFSFWGETKSRPIYRAICGTRDTQYQDAFGLLCRQIAEEGGYGVDGDVVALGLSAMMEGLWLRFMLSDGVTRQTAIHTCRVFLAAHYPRHFSIDGPI